jgi:hypothetical protein
MRFISSPEKKAQEYGEDDNEDGEEAVERRSTSHWVVTGVVPQYASL